MVLNSSAQVLEHCANKLHLLILEPWLCGTTSVSHYVYGNHFNVCIFHSQNVPDRKYNALFNTVQLQLDVLQ